MGRGRKYLSLLYDLYRLWEKLYLYLFLLTVSETVTDRVYHGNLCVVEEAAGQDVRVKFERCIGKPLRELFHLLTSFRTACRIRVKANIALRLVRQHLVLAFDLLLRHQGSLTVIVWRPLEHLSGHSYKMVGEREKYFVVACVRRHVSYPSVP